MASGRPPVLTDYKGDITKQTARDKEETQKKLFSYQELNATPPSYLKGEAKKEWQRVVPLLKKDTPISDLDKMTLINYCQTAGIIVDCQKYINRHGMFEDGKKSPYLTTQQQAMRDLKKYATTLGMTLESRQKMEYSNIKKDTPADEFKELLS